MSRRCIYLHNLINAPSIHPSIHLLATESTFRLSAHFESQGFKGTMRYLVILIRYTLVGREREGDWVFTYITYFTYIHTKLLIVSEEGFIRYRVSYSRRLEFLHYCPECCVMASPSSCMMFALLAYIREIASSASGKYPDVWRQSTRFCTVSHHATTN